MTYSADALEPVVAALLSARAGGAPADDAALGPHVTSLEEAYAVQERVLARLDGDAGPPRYWKSGGPARTGDMRHAPLPRAGVKPSGADLRALPLRHRWIEAEIALRVGRDLGADDVRGLQPADAGQVVDAMCVSIEVVDTRWAAGRDAPPLLKLADLLVHGALVLGEFVPYAARDWAHQACRVRIGPGGWQAFEGSLGIGDPAWVLPQWLQHATRHGARVPAGTVVSTGTWCGLLTAQAGDEVEADFPGVGWARLRL